MGIAASSACVELQSWIGCEILIHWTMLILQLVRGVSESDFLIVLGNLKILQFGADMYNLNI